MDIASMQIGDSFLHFTLIWNRRHIETLRVISKTPQTTRRMNYMSIYMCLIFIYTLFDHRYENRKRPAAFVIRLYKK